MRVSAKEVILSWVEEKLYEQNNFLIAYHILEAEILSYGKRVNALHNLQTYGRQLRKMLKDDSFLLRGIEVKEEEGVKSIAKFWRIRWRQKDI
jgi:hypothetical protein